MLESYQDLTDEQLIAVLKDSGDTDGKIMDYILDKYKPLVRKKANAVFLIGGETDDLIQEGMIGLFKAIRDFDNTKEASFFILRNYVSQDSYIRQLRRQTARSMHHLILMFLSIQKMAKTDIRWRKH